MGPVCYNPWETLQNIVFCTFEIHILYNRIEISDVQWHASVHGTMVMALWWALLTACVGEDSPPVTGQHCFRSLHLEFHLYQSHQKILIAYLQCFGGGTSLHRKAFLFWICGNFNPGFCDTIKRKGTMIEPGRTGRKGSELKMGDGGCKLCLLFFWGHPIKIRRRWKIPSI